MSVRSSIAFRYSHSLYLISLDEAMASKYQNQIEIKKEEIGFLMPSLPYSKND
jgi:hypothetical protein